jgi:hypothetical protein
MYGIVYLYVLCLRILHRESSDIILGDNPLISEVVLSHTRYKTQNFLQAKTLCREVDKRVTISLVGSMHDLESCHRPHTIFASIQLRGKVTHRGGAQIFPSSAVF